MLFLFFFAFFAGIATVLSPCVLPVLPALLAGGTGHGKWRPLGITIGLVASFAFFTLSISYIVQQFGISAQLLRYLAIAIIGFFGLVLFFPFLGDRFALYTSSIANFGVQIQSGEKKEGFWGGKDMDEDGKILVTEARKYDIIDLKGDYGRHTLTLIIPKSLEAYAFTFGTNE